MLAVPVAAMLDDAHGPGAREELDRYSHPLEFDEQRAARPRLPCRGRQYRPRLPIRRGS